MGSGIRLCGMFAAAMLFAAMGCGGEIFLPDIDGGTFRPGNQIPSADAGPDISAVIGETVILDAGASGDRDGDSLSYTWRRVSGPSVSITNHNQVQAEFVPPAADMYEFIVTVSDGKGESDDDTVRISVAEIDGESVPIGVPIDVPLEYDEDDVVEDAGDGLPMSDFGDGDEGWRVFGGAFTGEFRPEWNAGVVTAAAEGEWYWIAPEQFLGDQSAAYGRRLTIERMSIRCAERHSRGLVVISGSADAIAWGRGGFPQDVWTTYSLLLDETEEWYVASGESRASDEVIQRVLSDVTSIEIMGSPPCSPRSGDPGSLRNVLIR